MTDRRRWLAVALAVVAVACGGDSTMNPLSPNASVGGETTASNPDGTTVKATAPTAVSPRNGDRIGTRTPTLTFTNSVARFLPANFTYKIELYEVNNLLSTFTVAQAAGTTTSYAVSSELKYDTIYRWRARAEVGSDFTAWSTTADFVTPLPPAPVAAAPAPGSGGGGPFGSQRSIGVNEALAIIVRVHDAERWDLGSSSTREGRVEFWWRAVGIVHYGHPVYNPAGGDPNWCVKDAGGGRPPSDDVLVQCSSRDAWDCISGVGAPGYRFNASYLGRLPSEQNVYPPPVPR